MKIKILTFSVKYWTEFLQHPDVSEIREEEYLLYQKVGSSQTAITSSHEDWNSHVVLKIMSGKIKLFFFTLPSSQPPVQLFSNIQDNIMSLIPYRVGFGPPALGKPLQHARKKESHEMCCPILMGGGDSRTPPLQQRDAPKGAEWVGLGGCTMCLCCSKRGTGILTDGPAACVALKWSPVNRCRCKDILGTTKELL